MTVNNSLTSLLNLYSELETQVKKEDLDDPSKSEKVANNFFLKIEHADKEVPEFHFKAKHWYDKAWGLLRKINPFKSASDYNFEDNFSKVSEQFAKIAKDTSIKLEPDQSKKLQKLITILNSLADHVSEKHNTKIGKIGLDLLHPKLEEPPAEFLEYGPHDVPPPPPTPPATPPPSRKNSLQTTPVVSSEPDTQPVRKAPLAEQPALAKEDRPKKLEPKQSESKQLESKQPESKQPEPKQAESGPPKPPPRADLTEVKEAPKPPVRPAGSILKGLMPRLAAEMAKAASQVEMAPLKVDMARFEEYQTQANDLATEVENPETTPERLQECTRDQTELLSKVDAFSKEFKAKYTEELLDQCSLLSQLGEDIRAEQKVLSRLKSPEAKDQVQKAKLHLADIPKLQEALCEKTALREQYQGKVDEIKRDLAAARKVIEGSSIEVHADRLDSLKQTYAESYMNVGKELKNAQRFEEKHIKIFRMGVEQLKSNLAKIESTVTESTLKNAEKIETELVAKIQAYEEGHIKEFEQHLFKTTTLKDDIAKRGLLMRGKGEGAAKKRQPLLMRAVEIDKDYQELKREAFKTLQFTLPTTLQDAKAMLENFDAVVAQKLENFEKVLVKIEEAKAEKAKEKRNLELAFNRFEKDEFKPELAKLEKHIASTKLALDRESRAPSKTMSAQTIRDLGLQQDVAKQLKIEYEDQLQRLKRGSFSTPQEQKEAMEALKAGFVKIVADYAKPAEFIDQVNHALITSRQMQLKELQSEIETTYKSKLASYPFLKERVQQALNTANVTPATAAPQKEKSEVERRKERLEGRVEKRDSEYQLDGYNSAIAALKTVKSEIEEISTLEKSLDETIKSFNNSLRPYAKKEIRPTFTQGVAVITDLKQQVSEKFSKLFVEEVSEHKDDIDAEELDEEDADDAADEVEEEVEAALPIESFFEMMDSLDAKIPRQSKKALQERLEEYKMMAGYFKTDVFPVLDGLAEVERLLILRDEIMQKMAALPSSAREFVTKVLQKEATYLTPDLAKGPLELVKKRLEGFEKNRDNHANLLNNISKLLASPDDLSEANLKVLEGLYQKYGELFDTATLNKCIETLRGQSNVQLLVRECAKMSPSAKGSSKESKPDLTKVARELEALKDTLWGWGDTNEKLYDTFLETIASYKAKPTNENLILMQENISALRRACEADAKQDGVAALKELLVNLETLLPKA